jgi:probable F420-dependent oxidoreductase
MTDVMAAPASETTVPTVVEDLSAYVISGAVRATQGEQRYATVNRTPAQGVEDGVEAERLGFRRIWISERMDIKDAFAILAGVAARTSRIDVGTGAVPAPTRYPITMAAWCATMHACYGPRVVLGLGRGDTRAYGPMGIKGATLRYMTDYATILKQLWAGEIITYDGPVGKFEEMACPNLYDGPRPQLWYATFGNEKAADVCARSYDGAILVPMMSPEAVGRAVQRIRGACERIGRDPASFHICASVVTAPDLDDFETRALTHARALTYLTWEWYGNALVTANRWDPKIVEKIVSHKQFQGNARNADFMFHRHEMMEPAELVPDEWMADVSAIGTTEQCVASLQRFRDAGADEIATYGSTPGQNAKLIARWRELKQR